MADPIHVKDVFRSFGDVVAIDSVTMTVPQGALLGLIGPSGSGKTTLVRMLTGTLLPTSGEIRVLGEDPRAFQRATRERIGYVPQDFVLKDHAVMSKARAEPGLSLSQPGGATSLTAEKMLPMNRLGLLASLRVPWNPVSSASARHVSKDNG